MFPALECLSAPFSDHDNDNHSQLTSEWFAFAEFCDKRIYRTERQMREAAVADPAFFAFEIAAIRRRGGGIIMAWSLDGRTP